MRYLKRYIYGLAALGLWLIMMGFAYVIATYYVPFLPKTGLALTVAVQGLYVVFPVWIIVAILWFFAPAPLPGTGQRLTRKQKKMIREAQRGLH